MGKKETVDALVEGGKASAGPPIGSSLGPLKVNVGQIVQQINAKTAAFKGMKVPVKIIVDTETKEFYFLIPILYLDISSHSLFSENERTFIEDIGDRLATLLSSITFKRPQSESRNAIQFLRRISSSERVIALPSRPNISLKWVI